MNSVKKVTGISASSWDPPFTLPHSFKNQINHMDYYMLIAVYSTFFIQPYDQDLICMLSHFPSFFLFKK